MIFLEGEGVLKILGGANQSHPFALKQSFLDFSLKPALDDIFKS